MMVRDLGHQQFLLVSGWLVHIRNIRPVNTEEIPEQYSEGKKTGCS
jgi:hypothetical protein